MFSWPITEVPLRAGYRTPCTVEWFTRGFEARTWIIQFDRNIEIGWVGSQDVVTPPLFVHIAGLGVRFTYIRYGWFHFVIQQ